VLPEGPRRLSVAGLRAEDRRLQGRRRSRLPALFPPGVRTRQEGTQVARRVAEAALHLALRGRLPPGTKERHHGEEDSGRAARGPEPHCGEEDGEGGAGEAR
jgi:hypothetical protein